MIRDFLVDTKPFLDIIKVEMARQDLYGWDPDLGDECPGDLYPDDTVDDDLR
jgi:hypothetical protein